MNTERKNTPLPPLQGIPSEVLCAQDYERLAHHFLTPETLAYISGGSGNDNTIANNKQSFSQYHLVPRLFEEECLITTNVSLLGKTLTHPICMAPVAYQKLVHSAGEIASAQAAEATDSLFTSSTLSTYTLESIAANTHANRWFQLYLQSRWEDTLSLVYRAEKSGYQAIVLTIDTAIQLPSHQAIRAGFQLPSNIVAANLTDFETATKKESSGTIPEQYFASAPTLQLIKKLVKESPLPILIKGSLDPEQAALFKAVGVKGIVVSNHGGRTIDGVPASLTMLPKIRLQVGDNYPLILDSGIRSGSDVFKAIALGANAVMVGRLPIYALAVAGALGVAHVLKLLREEFEVTMAMTGCATISDITKDRLIHDSAEDIHANYY